MTPDGSINLEELEKLLELMQIYQVTSFSLGAMHINMELGDEVVDDEP